MLEGTIPPWCCSRTSVPFPCPQADSVWIVLGTHLSIKTVMVWLCIWLQLEIRWRLLRLAADSYHKEQNIACFVMGLVSCMSSWWCIWCVFIWWATLGGVWWCFLSSFSPCEATPGVLCAALQHKRERCNSWREPSKGSLRWQRDSRMRAGTVQLRECPRGVSSICMNVWKQGAKSRAGFLIFPVYHLFTLDKPF